MDGKEVLSRVTTVFRRVFDDNTLELSPNTTAQDVQGWDSLMHINLIVAIEREFMLRLTSREITALRNIGDLMALIVRKNGTAT